MGRRNCRAHFIVDIRVLLGFVVLIMRLLGVPGITPKSPRRALFEAMYEKKALRALSQFSTSLER